MTDRTDRYCDVALPRPVRSTFVYRLPADLAEAARPGMRVLVPFRRRRMVGCIDRVRAETELERVRPVLDLLDDTPLLPEKLLELCRWVADYYVAPLGLVLRAALPPGVLAESSFRVERVADHGAEGGGAASEGAGGSAVGLGDDERAVLDRLERARDGLQVTTLRRDTGVRSVWPALRSLAARGLVRIREEPPSTSSGERTRQVITLVRGLPTLMARQEAFGRAHRQREAYEALEGMDGSASVVHLSQRLGFSRSVLRGLEEKGLARITDEVEARDPFAELGPPPERPDLEPTPDQRGVLHALESRLEAVEPGTALLRGVTGSGKTLVYMRLLRRLLERGDRGAIVLVPEISLTPQTVQRFRAAFGDRIAVLHSGLSAGERGDEWRALREGRKRIAIGARSAVFAPIPALGAIVVDEEHEGSYKQSDVPRYHARAVAVVRARLEGALCVLGSATPSLESWHNATEGLYRLLQLPERVTGQRLPTVELVDLREEREARRARAIDRADEAALGVGAGADGASADAGPLVLSRRLGDALARCLDRGEQAILLLNRRGYSTFVQCMECGKVWSCPRCNVSLTYHRDRERIVCHHCGYEARVPVACDACGAEGLTFSGLGTEQVERRVGELFPAARLARMDVDTTGTRWAHHRILERVRRHEVDILLGTQMIAKGLDFPDVTLVGVINADVGLNLPDFRASERTFQLLAQVAGRAGRGERPGEVLVQTARPGHFALQAALRHDYVDFAAQELEDRLGPGYPPHRRLANLVVSGPRQEAVADLAEELADWIRGLVARESLEGVDVVGPAPCPIDRVRGRWRWHFLVKSDRAAPLGAVLRYLSGRRGQPSGGLRLEIDRDPDSLL
ncbi:MAG: primosomal protein N' [Candidatus Palauibacterales bacterium]|nr:primosomal protein N' [Candidatus Palauibacterales bacterium]MDP2530945.1 primosomal protein N' [Candidatus Palauibacterales bacterium]MDP2583388.1 primosomal protein N' [Candidatus Palauibacterales bacterium]